MLVCKICKIPMDDLGCYSRCPKCGAERSNVQVMKRVVGFYTDVRQWNDGKQEESKDRVPYKLCGGKKINKDDKK